MFKANLFKLNNIMKKLSLKDLKFGNNEKLDRNQMKTLFGGVDDSHAPEPFDESSGGGGSGGGPCLITCTGGVSLDGGPTCPTVANQDAICVEIGGGSSTSCHCGTA